MSILRKLVEDWKAGVFKYCKLCVLIVLDLKLCICANYGKFAMAFFLESCNYLIVLVAL